MKSCLYNQKYIVRTLEGEDFKITLWLFKEHCCAAEHWEITAESKRNLRCPDGYERWQYTKGFCALLKPTQS